MGSKQLILFALLAEIIVFSSITAVHAAPTKPWLRTYDIENKVARSWAMAISGPIIYLAGDSTLLSIVDTRQLNAQGLSAITQVQAFPSSGCGNFVAAEGGLVVKNGVAWVTGNYNYGYALSQVFLNNLTVHTFTQCDTSSPTLEGLAEDDAGNIYGAFQSTNKGVAVFNQTTHDWKTIAAGLGATHLLLYGTTIWFNAWPQGLGRVNTDGTGAVAYTSGFTTFTRDLARGSDGRIWFTGDHKFGVFDPSNASVREFSYGSADGPIGLSLDSYQKLWITGFWNGDIREYDPFSPSLTPLAQTGVPSGLPYSVGMVNGTVWGTILDPMQLFSIRLGPVADFAYKPSPPIVGQSTVFDGSPSSSLSASIVNYTWRFSDGQQGAGPRVSHFFQTRGTYNVSLTVTDSTGANDTIVVSIYASLHPYVPAVRPGLTASYILSFTNGSSTVSVSLQSTISSVQGSNVSYRVDLFNNQHFEVNSTQAMLDIATGEQTTLLPPFFVVASDLNIGDPIYTTGPYTQLPIQFINNTRLLGTLRTADYVRVDGPGGFSIVARFDRLTGLMTYTSASLLAGSTVEYVTYSLVSTNAWTTLSSDFSAISGGILRETFSSNTNGGESPYFFQWTFGDGQSSSDASPSHVFSQPGTYTITLTVTDSGGNTATIQRQVTVSGTPPNPVTRIPSTLRLPANLPYYLAIGLTFALVITLAAVVVEEKRKYRPLLKMRL